MKLSAVVAIKNSAERLPPLLNQLAMLADELVAIVDADSTDNSEVIARSYTEHVYGIQSHSRFNESLFAAFRSEVWKRCSGDWILRIDDDETLSPAWSREQLNRLMERREITHYYFPRRWLVVGGHVFLCNAPWYPDFQLRLMRNIPSIVDEPISLHRPGKIAGQMGFVTGLPIYHWNLLVYDRRQREQKVAESDRIDPATPSGQFYLFEDYYHQAEAYSDQPVRSLAAAEEQHFASSPYRVDTFILQAPRKFVVGETYAVEIEIRNRSTRPLEPEFPYREPRNLSFSHHWYQEHDGGLTVREFGASRSPLWTSIPVGSSHRAFVGVRAPSVPGEYILCFDVVEEFKAWFSEADSSGFREHRSFYVEPLPIYSRAR
jgi:glycosyltransferase involved in cell wall biosynthesis